MTVDPDQTPHDVESDLGLQFTYDLFTDFQIRMVKRLLHVKVYILNCNMGWLNLFKAENGLIF